MSDISLLLNVARDLRYCTLMSMIGKSVKITDRKRIPIETTAFADQFVDGCSFAGPENLYGPIAKYGILDVRFTAPPALLNTVTETGLPLLCELGFIHNDAQQHIEELEGNLPYGIEELRDGIAAKETHLMLFLRSSSLNMKNKSIVEIRARLRDPTLIRFPIIFTVVDACATNASYVWVEKHFYM